MWSLNVSTITGPPYAIFDISPKLGPLTGKTKVNITGDGFTESNGICVSFNYGKDKSMVVPGEWVSE
jgi:dynein heavy chain